MMADVVTETELEVSRSLLDFVRESPTAYHAVAQMRARLDGAGFAYLSERDVWDVRPGGRYYTTRNGSSLVAFVVGEHLERPHFRIAASHTDSPTFKVKAVPELEGPDGYLRLNTEAYGGAIDRSWLDRPLSVAGRVMVADAGGIDARLLNVDRDLLLIPSLAIHLDRTVNESGALDRHVDLSPVLSAGLLEPGAFRELVAGELGVESGQLLSWDLQLTNRTAGAIWGPCDEFVSAPRLDDLQCGFAAVTALISAPRHDAISVCACFDSEEIGSGTMQGALSTLLPDVLGRMGASLGIGGEDLTRAYARSIMVSLDNAQAVHPNHPELYDPTNRARINGGVVVKEAANQRYATNAVSRALFGEICRRAGVPTQAFANRSDKPGGSTLGNLALRQVSMHAVDAGLPQLAMHSAYETAGTRDTAFLVAALRSFYAEAFELDDDNVRFAR